MRKISKRFAAVAMASALAASMLAAMPVSAGNTYTPVSGTTMTFDKFLVVGAGDTVPGVTFTYSIAAGEAKPAQTTDTPKTFAVLPGPNPENVTVTPVAFTVGQTTKAAADAADIDVQRTAAERATGATAETGVEFETAKGEKFATSQGTVSFANVQFTEPGIYRYILTENVDATTQARGITYDNDIDRVLDVYVSNQENSVTGLQIAGYVLHKDVSNTTPVLSTDYGPGDVATAGAPVSDKTDGFTNEYKSKDLVFKKEVAGNFANRDKYFEFTLDLSGLAAGDSFVVSLADDQNANTTDGNADATSGTNAGTIEANRGKTNDTVITVPAGANSVSKKFYLQHGQSIAVRGLPMNAQYSVTENAEDFKSEAAAVEGFTDPVTSGSNTIGTIGTGRAVKTSYKNTKAGTVGTGVFMDMQAPILFAGVVLVGFIAMLVFRMRSRKNG